MSFYSYSKIFIKYFFGIILFLFCIFSSGEVSALQPPQLLFEKALLASKEGDFEQALRLWDDLIELLPNDAVVWSNRGNVRLALGDPDGAIVDQTKAMELMPQELDPHLNRGIAEEVLHLWEEAESDYQWILERFPNNSSALYNLANVRGSQGNWKQAELLFKEASLARPGFAMARSSKALADYQLGELQEAESELRMLIRRYPMMADARAALSALLWLQGFSGEAESNWVAASGLDIRYRQQDWLQDVRRWPPKPTKDLMAFLALESP